MSQTASFVLLALSVLVTFLNALIMATTRAAVSELKAELVEKLATRTELQGLESRVRQLERGQ